MIQSFDSVQARFLANFSLLTQRMANTQEQLSSGFRINKPSDDPSEVGDVLQLQSDIGRATQVASNLNVVQGAVSTAASVLGDATSLLDQAGSLAAQGANSTQTASDRTALSAQVEQILGELVNSSRTTFDGQYIFGGDDSTSAPYELNLANANGVTQLTTSSSTQLIQDTTGVVFAVSKTAQQIFDDKNPDGSLASDNVFAAVNGLRVALANNDSTGISDSLAAIQSASDYLNGQLAFYGSVQNRISSALDVAQKFQLQSQTSLSQVRDTDVAAATTDLTSETISQQASLQAEANMPHGSLFDYLK